MALGWRSLLVFAKLPDEFLDAELVEIGLALDGVAALVGEADLEAGIEEGEFAEARGEAGELELGGDGEDGRDRAGR